jgi:oligopeptide/dipeptide ABC transporter ATP-binding protein
MTTEHGPEDTGDAGEVLLRVRNLRTYFYTGDGVVKAVDGVDLTVRRGQTVGLVGESGSGKSVTSLSIMRLVGAPGRILEGSEILLGDADLAQLDERQMYHIRGNEIAMIFQEPMTSLNPVFTVGHQIQEAVLVHMKVGRAEAKRRAIEMLGLVGIPQPATRYDAFPHEMSGGMRQRVMIAMALACNPQLLIADRVAVMYAGQIVEYADVVGLFKDPKHPYTQGLLQSIPTLATEPGERLNAISGTVPNMLRLPNGCRFASRCPYVMPVCRDIDPLLGDLGDGRKVRCHLYEASRPPAAQAVMSGEAPAARSEVS